MPATVIDEYKIFPRLMMLVVTVLTYQSVHWYMSLPDPTNGQAGLVSVCMGALTGCFGIWMNKEAEKWLVKMYQRLVDLLHHTLMVRRQFKRQTQKSNLNRRL